MTLKDICVNNYKYMKFQAQVNKCECKVTIENDKEYTVVLKTMDERAEEVINEVSNWVEIEIKKVRGA